MTLTSLQIAFLQRLAGKRPSSTRSSAVAEFFAEHHYIGFRVGRSFEYGESHYEKAALLLTNLHLPLLPLALDTTRAETAIIPGISEKSGTLSPHSNSVAIKPISGRCTYAGKQFSIPAESYAVLTVQQACAVSAQRLMVVENFETFRLLERYQWIDYQGLDVLAIYRGEKQFRLNEARSVLVQRSEPTWMFSDFDPAGLAMAVGLPRLERVVSPEISWLKHMTIKSRRQDLFANQLDQYGRMLDRTDSVLIAPTWLLMKCLSAGLPQEWMAKAPSQTSDSQKTDFR